MSEDNVDEVIKSLEGMIQRMDEFQSDKDLSEQKVADKYHRFNLFRDETYEEITCLYKVIETQNDYVNERLEKLHGIIERMINEIIATNYDEFKSDKGLAGELYGEECVWDCESSTYVVKNRVSNV